MWPPNRKVGCRKKRVVTDLSEYILRQELLLLLVTLWHTQYMLALQCIPCMWCKSCRECLYLQDWWKKLIYTYIYNKYNGYREMTLRAVLQPLCCMTGHEKTIHLWYMLCSKKSIFNSIWNSSFILSLPSWKYHKVLKTTFVK